MRNTISAIRTVCTAIIGAWCLGACAHSLSRTDENTQQDAERYEVVYRLMIEQGETVATANIHIASDKRVLRELQFSIDPNRHSAFDGDGEISTDNGRLIWQPPRRGGTLSYQVSIPQRRQNGAFDARMTDEWALFRIGDVFPPIRTRTITGALSDARLELVLPDEWSALTSYLSGDSKFSFPFDNPDRNFDRPSGWVLIGDIGVRRGKIADTRVAIGSPVGENVHRMDLMAYLNWTLPELRRIFPTLDERLVIVSAGDPMWRGGLSGPNSLYIHADRPMISENGTSTLLHELVHVAMGVSGSEHDDWLVEGLAEYYSIKILRITETLSMRRRDLALQHLREWGEDVDNLFVKRSSGAITARAVTLLAELDAHLIEETNGRRSLDDVVVSMIENKQPYSYRSLCLATNELINAGSPVLMPQRVPGAPNESACL